MFKDAYPMEDLSNILVFSNNYGNKNNDNNKFGNVDNKNNKLCKYTYPDIYDAKLYYSKHFSYNYEMYASKYQENRNESS